MEIVTEAPWLVGLNASQRAAVEHDRGPLLVVAGAGTGKTGTLAARVAALLHRGVPPERILLLTFTRRAAAELLRRAGRYADPEAARRVWGGTFHSVGYRLLRIHGAALGLAPSFSVLDPVDATEVLGLVRAELELGEGRRRFPRAATLLTAYSRCVNAQEPLADVLRRDHPWCAQDAPAIAEVFRGYAERKRAQDLLDYDDLLLYWRAAARSEVVGPAMADAFDHVLVDEYQDTNALQADVVRALRARRDDVVVVGDDAQAIYGFRAATPRNLFDFSAHFPGTTRVTLEDNHRSTQPILDLANAVLEGASERFAKRLRAVRPGSRRPTLQACADESAQSDAVCRRVLDHRERGVDLRRQAVLFRAAHHSDLLEVELGRRGIPFVKYGGLQFLAAAHVKDLVALLRVLENPVDEVAWARVLGLVEGVGPATVRRLLAELGVRPRDPDADPAVRLAALHPRLPDGGRAELDGLASALAACGGGALPGLPAQVDRLVEALGPIVRRRYDAAEARLADLTRLGGLAEGHDDRARLVLDLTLDPPASTGDLAGPPMVDEDYLVLSTVHSAKGQEWDVVHVIHAADGMFPSDMATRDAEGVDEERRLFGVALTRARDDLHVYAPLRYHHRPRSASDPAHSYAPLTRFLPPAVHPLLDVLPADDRPDESATPAAFDRAAVIAGIAESLDALWT